MKERPILMRGPMVRATLEDKKWMTRRAIPIQPVRLSPDMAALFQRALVWQVDYRTNSRPQFYETDAMLLAEYVPAMINDGYQRYGKPGDRLWVRETWCECDGDTGRAVAFRADDWAECPADNGRWRPAIHMPRWASRLTLEITDVRVERVQDISLDDMRAEGARPNNEASLLWRESLRENFIALWDSINKKRGYGWEANPFVWAISYTRMKEASE